MLFDGISLVEGSEIQNATVAYGQIFPNSANDGELFYINDISGGNIIGLYVFNATLSNWVRQLHEDDSINNLLPDIATPGTYKSVTIDAKGLVSAGTNPTTLYAFGITDGQPLNADLTAIASIASNLGILKKTAANTWSLDTSTYLTANQSITVTGDVAGSGTTSINLVLGNSGVAAGSFGTATAVSTIQVDSKGRITSAANTSINIDASAVTTGTFANSRIAQSSVTQFQSNLTILESQITDGTILARVGGNETISGTWTFNNVINGTVSSSSTVSSAAQPAITSVGTLTGLTLSGLIQRSVALTISAAGTTQGTATVLTKEINDVTVVTSSSGVILPNSVGTTFIVMNHGANTLAVYPISGATIDAGVSNAAFSLPVGSKIMFIQISSTQYYTLNATYAG